MPSPIPTVSSDADFAPGAGGGGGVTLGGPQVGFTPGMIQYISAAGVQGGDVLFTRSSATNYTNIFRDVTIFERQGFTITPDVTGGTLANVVPGAFLIDGDTLTNVHSAVGTGDIGGFLGLPPGTAETSSIMVAYNSLTGDSASTKVWYYDGSLGGTASFRHETDVINGLFGSSFVADHSGFSAAADDIAAQQTGGLSLQNGVASAQLYVSDGVTNFNTGVLAGLTGTQMFIRTVFTGTKDWTLSIVDDVTVDIAALSYRNITDNHAYLVISPSTNTYQFGDITAGSPGNNNYFEIDDNTQLTDLWTTNLHIQSPNVLNAPLIYIDSVVMHTRLGYNAGGRSSLLAGGQNTYVGYEAGFGGAAGSLAQSNTAVGYRAGYSLSTTGDANSLFGQNAGWQITTGQNNSIFGYIAGGALTTQSENSLFGSAAGDILTSANNAMFGTFAGGLTTTGSNNTFFGHSAGITNATGSSLVLIGSAANVNAAGLNASIGIGREVQVTASNQLVFGSATYPIYEALIGDYLGAQNNTYFSVNDTTETVTIVSAGVISMGDLTSAGNDTRFLISDTAQQISFRVDGEWWVQDFAGNNWLRLDTTGATGSFIGGPGAGTRVELDQVASLIKLTNVPTFANDAAATGGGLVTGQLYKTTTVGTTALNIVP